MQETPLKGHLVAVWHAVIGKTGITSGHLELLLFSRQLSAEEERIFRKRCNTYLGHKPIETERFDVELEGICKKFQEEFTVEISIVKFESGAAVVVSAKEPPSKKEIPMAVHTALLDQGSGMDSYPVEKHSRGRKRGRK